MEHHVKINEGDLAAWVTGLRGDGYERPIRHHSDGDWCTLSSYVWLTEIGWPTDASSTNERG